MLNNFLHGGLFLSTRNKKICIIIIEWYAWNDYPHTNTHKVLSPWSVQFLIIISFTAKSQILSPPCPARISIAPYSLWADFLALFSSHFYTTPCSHETLFTQNCWYDLICIQSFLLLLCFPALLSRLVRTLLSRSLDYRNLVACFKSRTAVAIRDFDRPTDKTCLVLSYAISL